MLTKKNINNKAIKEGVIVIGGKAYYLRGEKAAETKEGYSYEQHFVPAKVFKNED